MRRPTGRNGRRGQVLPVFAIFLIVLLGMAALAVDVSGALSARRFYRSAADAAALAGAQDLQKGTTRQITDVERSRARSHALDTLVSLLGKAGAAYPGCATTSDVVECPLPESGYVVSIRTPSPTCVDCNPNRSVQVTVRNPAYGLAFARVLGSNSWNVASTSVAGLTYGKAYTIVTLRPPKKLGSTFDVKDIFITGGSVVNVVRGDVGTNANMEYSGLNSRLALNPDYDMFYYDPHFPPLWRPNPPGAQQITALIEDPNYTYPIMAGAPTFDDARTSEAGTAGRPVTHASTDPSCAAEAAKVDPTRYAFMVTQPLDTIWCYSPGIYENSGPPRAKIDVEVGQVGLLKPGAYYLRAGMAVNGRLVGGYEAGQPGVALMFDECLTGCTFQGNSAETIALNAGTKFPPGSGGSAATAAVDWAGNLVQTSGPSSPTPPLPLTLLVTKDPACFVPTSAPFIEPSACDANHNQTINVAGGGSLALEGVQYMPTDNVTISGGSSGTGHVGQIISWTLKYDGGTLINQEGPAEEGVGILRLDAACTAPSTPCNDP